MILLEVSSGSHILLTPHGWIIVSWRHCHTNLWGILGLLPCWRHTFFTWTFFDKNEPLLKIYWLIMWWESLEQFSLSSESQKFCFFDLKLQKKSILVYWCGFRIWPKPTLLGANYYLLHSKDSIDLYRNYVDRFLIIWRST